VSADGIEPLSRLTLVILNIATLDPNPAPAKPQKEIQKYNYTDGKSTILKSIQGPIPGQKQYHRNPCESSYTIHSSRRSKWAEISDACNLSDGTLS
jgi:hypothetical protein